MVKNNQNGEMEIDLLQLFRALWRNALVIILVAILFGGIAVKLLQKLLLSF